MDISSTRVSLFSFFPWFTELSMLYLKLSNKLLLSILHLLQWLPYRISIFTKCHPKCHKMSQEHDEKNSWFRNDPQKNFENTKQEKTFSSADISSSSSESNDNSSLSDIWDSESEEVASRFAGILPRFVVDSGDQVNSLYNGNNFNRAFHKFVLAKFSYGSLVLGSSLYCHTVPTALKTMLASNIFKIKSKIVILHR